MESLCFDRTTIHAEFSPAQSDEGTIAIMASLYAEYEGRPVHVEDEERLEGLDKSLSYEQVRDISQRLDSGESVTQDAGTALIFIDEETGEYRPLTLDEERKAEEVLMSLLEQKAVSMGREYELTKHGEYMSLDDWKEEVRTYRNASTSLKELLP